MARYAASACFASRNACTASRDDARDAERLRSGTASDDDRLQRAPCWSGGPTYAELVAILRKHSANPLADTETLFRWAVANLALGNRDAHAKNLSLLSRTPTERRLAPAYDVVCTMAYAALDDGLALRFGGQVKLDALRPDALPKAAREFGLTAAFARELVTDVCDRLAAARVDALQLAAMQAGEHAVLGAVDVVVHALTALTRAKLLGA